MDDNDNVGRRPSNNTPASAKRGHSVVQHQRARHELQTKLASPERRAGAVNAMYDRQFQGHGNSRHGAHTTSSQHGQRVLTGANPDGGAGRAVRKSSRWKDQQTQLSARHAAQNQFQSGVKQGTTGQSSGNDNLVLTADLGKGVTGRQATRLGSVKNPTGVSFSPTQRGKVVLRKDGGYLTDYPE